MSVRTHVQNHAHANKIRRTYVSDVYQLSNPGITLSCKKNRCSKLDQVKWIFLVYFSLSKPPPPPPPFVNDTSNGFAYLRTVPLKNDFYCTFNFASALKVLVYWDFLILFKGISEYRLSLGPDHCNWLTLSIQDACACPQATKYY